MQFAPKLVQLEKRFEELNQLMSNPAVISDGDQYRKIAKERADLEDSVGKFREWKSLEDSLSQARGMLQENDPELKAMAEEEVARLQPELETLEKQIKILLLPKDPNDERNVVLEIRAGTGGDEATLFADEVFRMYSRYAETQGWKMEVTCERQQGLQQTEI
jgi:peptide chain release factor 1